MNKPSIITTPSGDRMAVIPLAEYERLIEAVEDAADVRAYDEIKRKLARGEEEDDPRWIRRPHDRRRDKVRVWREYRGMTVNALAEASGLTAAHLLQIETGAGEGTVETFKRISAALSVTIDDVA